MVVRNALGSSFRYRFGSDLAALSPGFSAVLTPSENSKPTTNRRIVVILVTCIIFLYTFNLISFVWCFLVGRFRVSLPRFTSNHGCFVYKRGKTLWTLYLEKLVLAVQMQFGWH